MIKRQIIKVSNIFEDLIERTTCQTFNRIVEWKIEDYS